VWICWRIILKWILKKWRLWLADFTQYDQYIISRSQFSSTIFDRKRWISCPVDLVLKNRSAHTQWNTACLCSVMQPPHHTVVPKSV
jgi:hypothetical protein